MKEKIKNSYLFLFLKTRPLQTAGLIITIFSILMVLFGSYLIPNSPTTGISGEQLLPPCAKYPFGTDVNGMCVFSRTIAAYRTDLSIVVAGALLALGVGFPIGGFAGYFDGKKGVCGVLSTIILRVMDVMQAFPIFVLGLLLVAIFGPSTRNLRQHRTILSVESRRQIFWQVKQKAQRILCVFASIFVTVAGKSASEATLKASAVNCAVLP